MYPWVSALAVAMALAGGGTPPASSSLLVSAAVSLTEALTDCAAAFEAHTGQDVNFNFAASNALARQIVHGAPVDVFISADEAQMDVADRAGSLRAGSRVAIAGNTLAVIVPGSGAGRWPEPSRLLSPRVRRIAVGDPRAVPAGVYAMAWLQQIGMRQPLQDRLVPAGSVRGALALVAGGAVDAGIVYLTDARTSHQVAVVYEVRGPGAPSILYTAAVTRQSGNPHGARAFLQFLREKTAQQILARYGFTPPPAS